MDPWNSNIGLDVHERLTVDVLIDVGTCVYVCIHAVCKKKRRRKQFTHPLHVWQTRRSTVDLNEATSRP